MAAAQPQPLELKVHRLEVQNHWIIGIAVVAIIALVGLLAWFAVPRLTTPDAAATVDDLAALWTNHATGDAKLLYAEDAIYTGSDGSVTSGLAGIAYMVEMSRQIDLKAVPGTPIVQDGKTIVMPVTLTWYGTMEGESTPALHEQQVLTILQLDDAGMIVSHRDYGAEPVLAE